MTMKSIVRKVSNLSKTGKLLMFAIGLTLSLAAGIVVYQQKAQAHFNGQWGGGINWGPPGACPSSPGPLQTGWFTSPTTANFTITQGTASVSTQVGAQVHVCAFSSDCVYSPHFDFYNIDGRISGMPGQSWMPNLCPNQEATNAWTISIATGDLGPGSYEFCYQWSGWGWYSGPGWLVDNNSPNNWQCYHVQVNAPPPPSTPTLTVNCTNGNPTSMTISWSGTPGAWFFGTGYIVDISTNSSFNGYWNRFIASPTTSTIAPDGSNWNAQAPASGALSLTSGATYYVRVYNGSHSGTRSRVYNCPANPTCGSSTTTPANPEVGEPFQATVSFNNAAGSGPMSNSSYPMRLTVQGQAAYSNTVVAYTPNPVNGGQSGSHTTGNMTYATAGSYTVTWTIQGSGVNLSCPGTILITRKPYLRVYGGDVVSGIGFEPSCTKNSSSQIAAYNRGSSGGYGGAGAQFGVQAYGAVDQFVSAMLRGSNPAPPKGLTFANTSGTYGASFGDAPCIKDYYADLAAYHSNAPAIPTGIIFGTSGNWDPDLPFGNPGYGYRQRTGDLTLAAGTIELGTHRVIYVEGNVAITGDVFYAGYGSQDQIPSFYLIVKGNIYIDGNVTNLDGVFVAQPRANGTGGIIYTCSSGFAPVAQNLLYNAPNNNSSGCANKLTINGAFIANQVKFLRTVGSQGLSSAGEASSSANIAEVFNFSPELWLTSPGLVTGGTVQLDSITSLPPIL